MASVVTDGSWQTDKLQQQKQEWLLCHQRLKKEIHKHLFKNFNAIFYSSFIVILAVLRIILRSIFGLGVKHFFRRKALPFHLHIMECTCVTTCEADKPLWLEHLSNSYVIKTPDYFIILSHLCIIWLLAKAVVPWISPNICFLRICSIYIAHTTLSGSGRILLKDQSWGWMSGKGSSFSWHQSGPRLARLFLVESDA